MHKVILIGLVTDQRIRAIKALRAIWRIAPANTTQTPLGLREAKGFVDNAQAGAEPCFTQASQVEAEAIAAYLRVFGLAVCVEEPNVTLPYDLVKQVREALLDAGRYDLEVALAGMPSV